MQRSAHATRPPVRLSVSLLLALATVACGKKGPPLAPLRLVPAGVTEVSARVSGQDVQLRFGLPNKNLNGPGRIDLDRIEIYAITMPPGSGAPTNRDLLTKARVVGTISVKPPPVEGEPTEPEKPDPRPGPGDRVTFAETLTEEKVKPIVLPPPDPSAKASTPTPGATTPGAQPVGGTTGVPATDPATVTTPVPEQPTTATGQAAAPTTPQTPVLIPVQPLVLPGQPVALPETPPEAAGTTPPGAAAATPGTAGAPVTAPPAGAAPAPPAPPPSRLRRVYAMRGISHGGRPGQPTRIDVPILPPPPPVTAVRATFTERAITLNWQPPVAEPGGPSIAFNVYPAAPDSAPLNPAPQPAPSFDHAAMAFGREQCYVVRSVEVVQSVTFESESSSPICVTPRDIFPPEPPKELRGIASEGAIDLTWEANTESDLAGYLVLRAEGGDDTLRPLMKEPIHETTFHDPTVKVGLRYAYAVVALDRVGNRSKESGRFTETAR